MSQHSQDTNVSSQETAPFSQETAPFSQENNGTNALRQESNVTNALRQGSQGSQGSQGTKVLSQGNTAHFPSSTSSSRSTYGPFKNQRTSTTPYNRTPTLKKSTPTLKKSTLFWMNTPEGYSVTNLDYCLILATYEIAVPL